MRQKKHWHLIEYIFLLDIQLTLKCYSMNIGKHKKTHFYSQNDVNFLPFLQTKLSKHNFKWKQEFIFYYEIAY